MIPTILISIVITVLIFLACRVIVLWYWKIDKIVSLLKEIADSLSNKKQKEEEKQKISN